METTEPITPVEWYDYYVVPLPTMNPAQFLMSLASWYLRTVRHELFYVRRYARLDSPLNLEDSEIFFWAQAETWWCYTLCQLAHRIDY